MAKIKIVHVPVGEESQVIEIEDTLKAQQELVGGYIECHGVGDGVILVCNEDGVRLKLPQNGCGILGPYFFTRVDPMGDNVSLTDAECNAIRAHITVFWGVKHSGKSDFTMTTFATSQDLIDFLDERRREASGEFN